MIAGELVPAGTDVGCAMYGIFHDERIFRQAEDFVPERWLASDSLWTDHLADANHAFHPFSIGSRKCVGQNMAYAELTVALAKLVWHFDFRCPSEPLKAVGSVRMTGRSGKLSEEYRMKEFVTPLPEGPYLQFRPRLD